MNGDSIDFDFDYAGLFLGTTERGPSTSGVTLNITPEPATMGFLAIGGMVALLRRRRR